MRNPYTCFGHQGFDEPAKLWQVIYPVMNKEDLSPPVKLKLNCFLYKFIIENMEFCIYSLPVWWRCAHDGKVACPHQ
ncbi:hypothetical protein D3C87_1949540 [compost metagenome]